MQNPKPAPFNVVPDDPTGTTWALPEGLRINKRFTIVALLRKLIILAIFPTNL